MGWDTLFKPMIEFIGRGIKDGIYPAMQIQSQYSTLERFKIDTLVIELRALLFLFERTNKVSCLHVLILSGIIASRAFLVSLSLDTSRSSTAEGTGKGELNVLLAVETHHERRNVYQPLADTDVTLLDEHTSVVDGLGVTSVEHDGLEPAVEELLHGQTEDVVQLVLSLGDKTQAHQATQKGSTFEQPLVVLLGESKKSTGHSTDLGKSKLHTPDLTLVAQSILSEKLHLAIETLLLERTAGNFRAFARVAIVFTHGAP